MSGPTASGPAATFEPLGPLGRTRAWQALVGLLTVVLAGSLALRPVLADGPYWTEGFAAYLIGLAPLWIVAVSRAVVLGRPAGSVRLAGTALAGPRGPAVDLTRVQVRLASTLGATHRLWLRLTAGDLVIELTDPYTGVPRDAGDLAVLAEALRHTRVPAHAAVADRVAVLAGHGLLAALQPEPAVPDRPDRSRPAAASRPRWRRLLYGGLRVYLAVVILAGLPFYVAGRVAASRDAGGPTGDELLGYVGVGLLFGLAGAYILRKALADMVGSGRRVRVVGDRIRQGLRHRSLRTCDTELIVVGGEEVPGTHFALRRRIRPVLRVAAPGRPALHLDLADRATGEVLPAAELQRLADAVAVSGRRGADRTGRQLRELASHRRVGAAAWLSGPPVSGSPLTPAGESEARGGGSGADALPPEIGEQLARFREAMERRGRRHER